ncbi:TIGR02391 family protein [Streptomyces caniscabiei]|uniref:TIGR02391 family protein n=1 Tax=Streptomyces caniscabiei TaxID=2746961 RepID=UPI0029A80BA6|nr:TIGR02391 family protein [Streptomyces caniscabiei]MDX2776502.1 TIGR02391 family protein [Streptomyces caniscabiei]
MEYEDNLASAVKDVEDLIKRLGDDLQRISRHIIKTTDEMDKSWSGSWIGYHANLYFKNYEAPLQSQMFSIEWGGLHGYDPGWHAKRLNEVWQYIIDSSPVKFEIDTINDQFLDLQEANKSLKILYELNSRNEVLTKKIQEVDVEYAMYDYIKARNPGRVMSRDSEATNQGLKVPPHIQCQAFGRAVSQALVASKHLLKLRSLIAPSNAVPATIQVIDDELAHLNPRLASKIGRLYADEHYSEAVGMALRMVKDRLRDISGYENGFPAFTEGGLYIKGAAATNVDNDFQEAVKRLLGSIDKFRNEKFHTSMAELKSKDKALCYLHMCSLALSFLADEQYVIKKSSKKEGNHGK